jgi:hypothetical protein
LRLRIGYELRDALARIVGAGIHERS